MLEDMPDGNDWLNATELLQLQRLRFEKRRTDWRLGRWSAKQAVAAYLRLEPEADVLSSIEIRPNPTGAPEALLQNQEMPISISLSHCCAKALCAVGFNEIRLGCDIEHVEPRPACFVNDYFTSEEQLIIEQLPRQDQPTFVTLFWSAKESALKALGTGLRRDTRSVSVSVSGITPGAASCPLIRARTLFSAVDRWFQLKVTDDSGQAFQGWWRCAESFVRTIIADNCVETPIQLGGVRPQSLECNLSVM